MRILILLLISLTIPACAQPGQLATFPSRPEAPPSRSRQIDYRIDPSKEQFYVYCPTNYTPDSSKWGLIVYISPSDSCQSPPSGWDSVIKSNKLLFICPQKAGNGCELRRRCGLGVMAALEMMLIYKIDPSRVYVAGLSGGARTAGKLGFCQSDLFRGTIQSCGCDFYKRLPDHLAKSHTDSNGGGYGLMEVSQEEVQEAKNKTKFVFITGPGDFRRGNIVDIYQGGYLAEGFMCKLFDVPGMGHQDCSGAMLQQALNYLK